MKDLKIIGAILAFLFLPILACWLIIGLQDNLSPVEVIAGVSATLIGFGLLNFGLSKIKYPDQ